MEWITAVSILLVAIASVHSKDDVEKPPSQDTALNNLLNSDTLSNLPALQGLDVSQFNLSQAPTIEDAERLFKEKCMKNADLPAYEHAHRAKDDVKACFLSLVNVTVLQEEMETAKPTGDLDTVFRKYCRKSPTLRQCVSNFTAAMEPCLDEQEKEGKHIVQNITDSLVQFICFKEGDRIALFIAEGGPECISAHQDDIQECVNQTLSKHIPNSVPSINNLPPLVLGPEQCRDMRVLQNCVVRKLEGCKEPTPANIVESMFNFIYKVTPCGKMRALPGEASTLSGDYSSTSSSMTTSYVLVATLASLLATRVMS